jgi:hypothetical protein
MIHPGKPFGLEWSAAVASVEHELYAGWDAQLAEDTKQVCVYGGLAKAQFPGCVAIAQALGYKGDNLFFSRGKHLPAPGIKNPQLNEPRAYVARHFRSNGRQDKRTGV